MIDEKRRHILGRALEIFFKYGFKRVSMNEIAEAAGISRPGLYLYFQSKEQVFNEAIAHLGGLLIQEISAGLGTHKSVDEKLLYAFEVWTIRNFDRNKSSAEMQEIVDLTPLFAREAHREVYVQFDALLASVISGAGSKIEGVNPAPDRLAHIPSSAMRGFKFVASDSDDLRQLMKDLIALTLQKPRKR